MSAPRQGKSVQGKPGPCPAQKNPLRSPEPKSGGQFGIGANKLCQKQLDSMTVCAY